MEFDVTIEEAKAILSTHGGYGAVRLYGYSADYPDQMQSIKSEHKLDTYHWNRVFYKTNNGQVPISKA